MKVSTPEHRFWDWFKESEESYLQLETPDIEEKFSLLGERIREVDEDLTFAISPPDAKGKRELIISADGLPQAFPAVMKLVTYAPQLPNWDIIPFRPKVAMDHYHIDLGHSILKAEDIRFEFQIIEGRLELHLYIKGFAPDLDDQKIACQILLDSLLGEYDAATKIQFLAFHGLDELEQPDQSPQLELLPMLVDDLRKGKIEGTIPIVPEKTATTNSYEVEESFALMKGMFHQFPNYVLINPNFYQFSRKEEFPWLLTLTFNYSVNDDKGLPDEVSLELLNSNERDLTQFLNSYTKTYFVYRITWNGQRQVFFHLQDWFAIEGVLPNWILTCPMEAEFEIAYERDWESTRAMLYLLFQAQKD